jgi:hypothetical protein
VRISKSRLFAYALLVALAIGLAHFAWRHAGRGSATGAPPRLTRIAGTASYFVCSDPKARAKHSLPAIIVIGHTFEQPDRLTNFVAQFDEPVLLIWSDLLSGLTDDARVDDAILWKRKRDEFSRLLARFQDKLHFDPKRIYLTGFSFAGVYAWMLAYDHPARYAGVVAMSAVSYPQQIQQRLQSAESLVTVVVRGETDPMVSQRLAQEKETGLAIESRNPHSRFIIKPGESHKDVARYWLENLNYILRFTNSTAYTD